MRTVLVAGPDSGICVKQILFFKIGEKQKSVMNARDILIALLRYAIRGGALDKGALEKALDSKKVATLFTVAQKHDVAHLVALALEDNGIAVEGEAWQGFLKEKEQAALRYEMIQADISEICACFEKEKIDHIPLKGAVLRPYYPQPWYRTSCDIDILVQERDLDRAVDALVKQLGYRVDGKKTYHDISLYSPFGMHLELHHNIKENKPEYDGVLSRVWENAPKVAQESCGHRETNEFLLFHLTAHMAYHFASGGCGLRSVLDLWVLNHHLSVDENSLALLLKEAGLDAFYRAMVSLSEYWFGDESSPLPIVQDAEKFILLGGAYGTSGQGAITRQVKRGGKFKYFWSRVFMPYENLAILYPVIKKHKILTPFCQVARWFGVIFKTKRIRKEIKKVVSADKAQIEATAQLLGGLGL